MPRHDDVVVAAAIGAAANAHAPHSGFRVGAAVEDSEGTVHGGCNVESDAYGLTQCAERNALFRAVADGAAPRSLRRMVIYTPTEWPCPPCGACRQVIFELMAPDSEILALCDSTSSLCWTPAQLLPGGFELPGD